MRISSWPNQERPREKLLTQGPHALSDAELLAIFLRTGTKGQSAVDVARSLLLRFKNLRHLLEAKEDLVCETMGMGSTKYAQIQAALELGRRYLQCHMQDNKQKFNNSQVISHYFKAELRHHTEEVFACLFLDSQHRFIAFEKLFFGTINQSIVYPRKIIRRALHHNAAAIILAHNHPSGSPTPSPTDLELTQHIQQTLALIDVRVLDHIIVGDKNTLSIAELNLL